jgi:hypothetical protein
MPMPKLWTKGFERAQEVNFTKSINHSKLAHKWGLGQGVRLKASAVTNVAKMITKPFLALIPVPVVGGLVGMALEEAADKARAKYREKQTAEANQLGQEQKIKFGIKNLDIGDWDRYRYKAGHSYNELKKALDVYMEPNRETVSVCNDAFRLAYKYHYYKKRTAKLKLEAEAMKVICDDIIAWIDDLESKVDRADVETQVRNFCENAEARQMEIHSECDSEYCVHKEQRKGAWADDIRQFRKLTAALVSSSAEPIVDLSGDIDFS